MNGTLKAQQRAGHHSFGILAVRQRIKYSDCDAVIPLVEMAPGQVVLRFDDSGLACETFLETCCRGFEIPRIEKVFTLDEGSVTVLRDCI